MTRVQGQPYGERRWEVNLNQNGLPARAGCVIGKMERRRTDICTDSGEDMPPPVQLEEKRPRHSDGALGGCEARADGVVDVPEDEPGYEDDCCFVSRESGCIYDGTRNPYPLLVIDENVEKEKRNKK